ncbi:MAG: hypothetical protein DI568_00130 [Sphingomonas sp.]|nr:MAG: hypothetical protein DI568_00130 [Sphingomonas sp.]
MIGRSAAGSSAALSPRAADMLDVVPDSFGPKLLMKPGGVASTRASAGSIRLVASTDIALVMLTPQPQRSIALASDRWKRIAAPAGHVELIPAGADLQAAWAVSKSNIFFAMDAGRLADLAAGEFDRGAFEWIPGPGAGPDEQAHLLARMIDMELLATHRPVSALAMDSLLTLLGLHLLRTHSSLADTGSRALSARGGLSPHLLRRVEEHMAAHLAEEVGLAELAALCGVSAGHFLRSFRQSTGETPHRCLMRMRLERAIELIGSTRLPVHEIASLTGFSSHSHLTSTMSRMMGRTPRQVDRPAHAARGPSGSDRL